MSTSREYRTERIPIPKNSAALARLMQRLLTLSGLVSCSITRDGIEVSRYRSLHDPLLGDGDWPDSTVSEVIGTLEEIHELPGVFDGVGGILTGMHFICALGFEPKVLLSPSSSVTDELSKRLGGNVSVAGVRYIAGLRVEESPIIADNTFVVLGSVIGSYDLSAVRVAVRAFITDDLGVSHEQIEYTGGEDSTTGTSGY